MICVHLANFAPNFSFSYFQFFEFTLELTHTCLGKVRLSDIGSNGPTFYLTVYPTLSNSPHLRHLHQLWARTSSTRSTSTTTTPSLTNKLTLDDDPSILLIPTPEARPVPSDFFKVEVSMKYNNRSHKLYLHCHYPYEPSIPLRKPWSYAHRVLSGIDHLSSLVTSISLIFRYLVRFVLDPRIILIAILLWFRCWLKEKMQKQEKEISNKLYAKRCKEQKKTSAKDTYRKTSKFDSSRVVVKWSNPCPSRAIEQASLLEFVQHELSLR